MQDLYELKPPDSHVRLAIDALCEIDVDFLKVEAQVGPVKVLTLPPTFAALVRIIVGQQLATSAARSIFRRLEETVPLTPEAFLKVSDELLQQAGLSRAKIICCRKTAEACVERALDLEMLGALEDKEILKHLTAIKGIGPWTAEIFMLFALERMDIFPAGDLALQRAYVAIKQLGQAITVNQLIKATDSLKPYRGAAAHLLWHYYRNQ